MRSYLYRAIPCPAPAEVTLPPRTLAYTCLEIDSDYPAATLAELLAPCGSFLLRLPFGGESRCLELEARPDPDTVLLLAALGVDATVTATPMLLLEGIDDAAFRALRDALCPAKADAPAPRRLPDDAFVGFTRTPLEAICAEAMRYGLSLPEPCLGVIADHFRALGRDPWPDELLLLDEAYCAAVADPAVAAPVEFITDDERLHIAYADAMAKRRVLHPEANAPATLSELASLATDYLCAHRGTSLPPYRFNLPVAARRFGGFATVRGETCAILAKPPIWGGTVGEDDRVVLLHTDTGKLDAALERLFAEPAAAKLLHRADHVDTHLLATLGRLLGETGLGLSLMPPPDGTALTDRLLWRGQGLLLVCAPNAGRTLPEHLRAAGLAFTLIGRLTRKPNLVLDDAPNRLCLPVAMLAPRPAVYAEARVAELPPAPTDIPPHAALLTALRQAGERYGYEPRSANQHAQFPFCYTVCNDIFLSALTVTPTGDPYAEIRDAALALVMRLTALGAKPDRITLAMSATLPIATSYDCGRAIAAMLGLHAVQVELGLLAEPADLRAGEELRVTLAVQAPADEIHPPSLDAGMPLWLIAPRSNPPHLDGERALLALTEAIYRAKSPIIATELLPPAVAVANAALEEDVTAVLTAPDEVLNTVIPCGIVVASPEMPRLPEGVAAIALGYTAEVDDNAIWLGGRPIDFTHALAALRGDLPAPILPAPTVTRPPHTSSHRCARPRAVIPYRTDALLPLMPGQLLHTLGAEPVLFPLDLHDAASARQALTDFAEAVDGAQMLLLGDDGALTEAILAGHRSAEALARMRARDALIYAWGGAFACLLAHGVFSPDGAPIAVAPLRGQRILSVSVLSSASPWMDKFAPGDVMSELLSADPLCPCLDIPRRNALLEAGRIIACASGTPDGKAAVVAMTTPDGCLLGSVLPPARAHLRGGIAYFA